MNQKFLGKILICSVLVALTNTSVWARSFGTQDVLKEINNFNQEIKANSPDLYQKKMNSMAGDPFSFYRGTAHLMNSDFRLTPDLKFLRNSPKGQVVGDLHIHNFSVLKAKGKLPVYAIDDLDESFADAPLGYDIFRLCVSLVVGFKSSLSQTELTGLVEAVYSGYKTRAQNKTVFDWPVQPASRNIKAFIEESINNDWKKFLHKKTAADNPNSFRIDKFAPVPESEKKSIQKVIAAYLKKAVKAQKLPKDFVVIKDIAQRFDKGLSSIGLKRYFVLLEGESDSWEDDRIIEIKKMRCSSVAPTNISKQVKDTLNAFVLAHQDRDCFYGALEINRQPFLVRQNFPWSKTVEVSEVTDKLKARELAYLAGWITADFHASSKNGKKMVHWLKKCSKGLTPWIFAYARQVFDDWNQFKK